MTLKLASKCTSYSTGLSKISPRPRTIALISTKRLINPVRANLNSDDVDPSPSTFRKPNPTKAEPVTPESMQELLEELLDTSQFGQRGEGWFIAQAVLILLVLFPPSGLYQIVDTVGGIGIVAGLTMITLGGLELGQNLTPVPKPRDTHSLVTTGIYEAIRHPMYGGIIVAAAGLSLATGSEARLALTALTFFVLNEKASYEEDCLVERYGEEYRQYQRKSKKLIPWLF